MKLGSDQVLSSRLIKLSNLVINVHVLGKLSHVVI